MGCVYTHTYTHTHTHTHIYIYIYIQKCGNDEDFMQKTDVCDFYICVLKLRFIKTNCVNTYFGDKCLFAVEIGVGSRGWRMVEWEREGWRKKKTSSQIEAISE